MCWVYPRVCGGTDLGLPAVADRDGLSPRVRGNHRPGHERALEAGSIPACAGEPYTDSATCRTVGRRSIPACAGEPCSAAECRVLVQRRSIPACAGEPAGGLDGSVCRSPITGLSPRVRGNPVGTRRMTEVRQRRSIPACAGEPAWPSRLCPDRQMVYPRVCGGTRFGRWLIAPEYPAGVYPRVCGGTVQVHHGKKRRCRRRSIPACAGEPGWQIKLRAECHRSIPACAGEPRCPIVTQAVGQIRSIPACAGEPFAHHHVRATDVDWSIPACAGEPSGRQPG